MPQRPAMTPRRLFQDEATDNENQNENAINYNDDNAANVLLEEMAKTREEAKAKWNFDFAREEPLEGVWEWERVEPTAPPNMNSNESQENNQNTTNTQGCA